VSASEWNTFLKYQNFMKKLHICVIGVKAADYVQWADRRNKVPFKKWALLRSL